VFSKSATTAAPTASIVDKKIASAKVCRNVRKDRHDRRSCQVRDADCAILKSRVDSGFLDLRHQLFVQLFVGVGFALHHLVFVRARVHMIELDLDAAG
jgi:hypothetical protein